MGALSPRGGARPRWLDAARPYAIVFAAAFLSSLSGFMMGSGIGLHHTALRSPDSDLLGAHRSGPSIAAAQADAALHEAALAAARAAVAPEPTDACRTEERAEYGGEFVVKWGEYHLKDTAAECCASCANHARCNVWVWCADPGGCSDGMRKHKECWLKEQKNLDPQHISGIRGPDVKWVSGARFSREDAVRRLAADYERRLRLRANASLPLVYLDVGIRGKYVGRVEIVLFTHTSPRSAENFRQLCTGERGIVPQGREGAGQPYHFKGRPFYRIVEGFIDQAGAEVESVFGGEFRDDAGGLQLKHDRIGLLSMANAGPNTNTAHFSIMLGPAHHLDGSYTIFGEVVSGLEAVRAVNALAKGRPGAAATAEEGAFIIDSGQLRRGAPVTADMLAAARRRRRRLWRR
ncbi:peptidyl-prolyl cis-trans isomerase D [Raphidocelis subcapitata]|uniref:Peptidyl-prolyl cis-trans isomerase D n=1 Tax=Raphidocelis subcapitata TaxID=307507 RepID=A0A2V0P2D6_9CHLO|nr:peptidyl-prolyl cis-trans isomerase D [Raphidocelis subcapitata]|eukprot:GBF94044.1 peptidyl-prolyl cis-trans isomerase D [Raphidocelis subcapitata]